MKQFLVILGFSLLSLPQLATAQSANDAVTNGFKMGYESAARARREREAAEAQARLEEEQHQAELKRQRESYDLQLRNEQAAEDRRRSERDELAKRQTETESRNRANAAVDQRTNQWSRVVDNTVTNIDVLWKQALSDAGNPLSTAETKKAANEAMRRLQLQKREVLATSPNFEDRASFQESVNNLPNPELGYTAEFTKHLKKSKPKKKGQ